jgi:hypothetical protein
MFGRASSRSLKLQVGDSSFEFLSPEDLAFALAGRAGVPGNRVTSLVDMTDDALRREAEAIRKVEQMFNNALDGLLRDVTSISPFLKEIDPNLISQDHEWRTIIAALNASNEPHEPYKKVALVKYVQYLAARRQAVTAIYSARRGAKPAGPDTGSNGKLRETAIFDLPVLAEEDGEEFARMPKGETVEIDLSNEGSVTVLLAKHPCRIEFDGGTKFIDDADSATGLRRGKNIVGRDASCDVPINATYREVSRKHLIIELDAESTVRLTDISSHGTSLSPRHLENTSI